MPRLTTASRGCVSMRSEQVSRGLTITQQRVAGGVRKAGGHKPVFAAASLPRSSARTARLSVRRQLLRPLRSQLLDDGTGELLCAQRPALPTARRALPGLVRVAAAAAGPLRLCRVRLAGRLPRRAPAPARRLRRRLADVPVVEVPHAPAQVLHPHDLVHRDGREFGAVRCGLERFRPAEPRSELL